MNHTISAPERRATLAISSIMGLRMLGLFLILPVFSLYASDLENVTPTLIGLAIGAYGFTQALLQIPFGLLSDRFGRKPMITFGLILFAIGSVVAALSDGNIYGIIFGRILQGAGAVSAVLMALTADLTREENRTKAMATIGMSIGSAFLLSLIISPMLNAWIGVPGMFWLIALLAIAAIGLLHTAVPTPVRSIVHRDAQTVPAKLSSVLKDSQLLRLDFGILTLHMQLTAMFVVIPLALLNDAKLPSIQHWQVYLPVMLASVAVMIPCIIIAEKYRKMKWVFSGAVATLMLVQLGLSQWHDTLFSLVIALWIFFSAFNLLEASLPSLISKTAPPASKGTAMGVYASGQFFGAFLGGLGGGWLFEHYGMGAVFLFCSASSFLWLILAVTMKAPKHLSSHLLNVGKVNAQEAEQLSRRLLAVTGVAEAVVVCEENVAYLKVDRKQVDFAELEQFAVS